MCTLEIIVFPFILLINQPSPNSIAVWEGLVFK
jgi:hypothetical protein